MDEDRKLTPDQMSALRESIPPEGWEIIARTCEGLAQEAQWLSGLTISNASIEEVMNWPVGTCRMADENRLQRS